MRFWRNTIWWHRRKHMSMEVSKVTIGMFDSSRGLLYKCGCGKVWAK